MEVALLELAQYYSDVESLFNVLFNVNRKNNRTISLISKRLQSRGISALRIQEDSILGVEKRYLDKEEYLYLTLEDIVKLQDQKQEIVDYFFNICSQDKSGKLYTVKEDEYSIYNDVIEISEQMGRVLCSDDIYYIPLIFDDTTFWGDLGWGTRNIPEDYNGRNTTTISLSFYKGDKISSYEYDRGLYYHIGEGLPCVN